MSYVDPSDPANRVPLPTREELNDVVTFRLLRDLEVGPGCWIWHGPRTVTGYGRVQFFGRPTRWFLVHRLMYRLFVGEIPADLELDHTCETETCARPSHLQPVTHGENCRRRDEANGLVPREELTRGMVIPDIPF